MWRNIRIIILLLALAAVAYGSWYAKARAASWTGTLRIAVYPINADQAPATSAFVSALTSASFRDIEDFIEREARRHGRDLTQPASVSLAPEVREHPPTPPHAGNVIQIAFWSLRLRYWAWRHDKYRGPKPHVRLFVIYHDPQRTQRVPHSLGLEKGMLGVVHAFASPRDNGSNNVVIAHELLHTLGATDKYDSANNLPRFPDGYAEPERSPRYPQLKAEIMGGRIPIDDTRVEMPTGLADVVTGARTAMEINLAVKLNRTSPRCRRRISPAGPRRCRRIPGDFGRHQHLHIPGPQLGAHPVARLCRNRRPLPVGPLDGVHPARVRRTCAQCP